MKEKEFVTAIVLAAGRGTRMGTKIQKQYLDLCGKPVLYYSLQHFRNPSLTKSVVTGEQEIEYCRKNCRKISAYKSKKILAGGAERIFLSGMESRQQKIKASLYPRWRQPFVDEEMIERCMSRYRKKKHV